jgi:hypothetical protein
MATPSPAVDAACDTFVAAEFDGAPRLDPLCTQQPIGDLARAGTALAHQPDLRIELLGRHPSALRARRTRWRDDPQLIVTPVGGDDAWVIDRPFDQCQIDLAVDQCLANRRVSAYPKNKRFESTSGMILHRVIHNPCVPDSY